MIGWPNLRYLFSLTFLSACVSVSTDSPSVFLSNSWDGSDSVDSTKVSEFDSGVSGLQPSIVPVNSGAKKMPISPLCMGARAENSCDPDSLFGCSDGDRSALIVADSGLIASPADAESVVQKGAKISNDGSSKLDATVTKDNPSVGLLDSNTTFAGKPGDAAVVATSSESDTVGLVTCRIRSESRVSCETAGMLTAGKQCQRRSDCAAGYDCVRSEKSEQTYCRRLCCSGSCENAEGSGPTYCDFAKTKGGTPVLVPVCLPIKACTLLDSNSCERSETCAVVDNEGKTSCLLIGKKNEGESCEKEHCASQLSCFGLIGERKCYRLCTTGKESCPGGKICTSLFSSRGYGVCLDKTGL